MAERTHPLAALAGASPACAEARLSVLPPVRRTIIHGDASDHGLLLPDLCRATLDGDLSLLRLGPDEFLLLASDTADSQSPANAVDVSHRDVAIAVSGPRAAWVVNAFCALDLHESAFTVGMCTRTMLGKAEIILWRTSHDTFRIDVARSFAPYVWACLEEARREFLA